MHDIYPLCIVKDRYGGTYSRGRWTAWNRDADDVPFGPFSDDLSCSNFWEDYQRPVGKGSTIEEAIEDLRKQLDAVKD